MGVPGRQVVVRRQPQQPREEVGAKPCRASVLSANLFPRWKLSAPPGSLIAWGFCAFLRNESHSANCCPARALSLRSRLGFGSADSSSAHSVCELASEGLYRQEHRSLRSGCSELAC